MGSGKRSVWSEERHLGRFFSPLGAGPTPATFVYSGLIFIVFQSIKMQFQNGFFSSKITDGFLSSSCGKSILSLLGDSVTT